MNFSGRIVWITGASSGIGEALAHAFAAAGAKLVLSSRRAAELERVRLACENPEDHFCLPLDLTHGDRFPALVAGVLQRFGRIDILVNNGGVGQRAHAIETDAAVERAIMETDYFGAVALTKAVLPSMLVRHAGHIVVVSSVMGYVGTPGRSSYAAAKHALHGWFDSLRAEVWRDHIRVTLACPGYVRTGVLRMPSARPAGRTPAPTPRTNAASPPTAVPARSCAASPPGARRSWSAAGRSSQSTSSASCRGCTRASCGACGFPSPRLDRQRLPQGSVGRGGTFPSSATPKNSAACPSRSSAAQTPTNQSPCST